MNSAISAISAAAHRHSHSAVSAISAAPEPSPEDTMRIRLHGTPEEITAALDALPGAFEVSTITRAYRDRPPSRLIRVYLDAMPVPTDSARERP